MSEEIRTPTKTIAIDFDGTLFKSDNWPEIGEPIWVTILLALEEQKAGADLILWTTRSGKELADAVAACKEVGLEFTAVNENTPYMKHKWGTGPRKVGADEYWDDRAIDTFKAYIGLDRLAAAWVAFGLRSGMAFDEWCKRHPSVLDFSDEAKTENED